MTAKQVLFRSQAREKVLRGAAQLADAVRITLGPKSKSVLIQKKWGTPIVCNDGVTIAKEMELEDAEENLGAQMLRQAADEFSRIFDGFSIGSNDLTQLTLGVDRDSAIVAFDFDERDPGVKEMIRLAVEGSRRNHRHSGLCGQAPSDFPEFADFLVRLGIDSISLNPDAVVKMTRRVLEIECQLGNRNTRAA
jgi:PEP-utilising enzyme, PEP-binding domain/TCP-1/cpn60 chaperonin family